MHKVGVAIGDQPVTFAWQDLSLSEDESEHLRRLAEDVTVLGAARSPVVVSIGESGETPVGTWSPITGSQTTDVTEVRAPTADTPAAFDRWHERRRGAATGAPRTAPYVPPATTGVAVAYRHSDDPVAEPPPLDAGHWGDIIVLAVDRAVSDAIPKGPASFAFTRAFRKALLATYAAPGAPGDAPPILRGRGSNAHVAILPLNFVALHDGQGPAARHADGHTLGVAVVLPHELRTRDVSIQRLAVERGLMALCLGIDGQQPIPIEVPRVGNVVVRPLPGGPNTPVTLTESTYRRPSRTWTTVTPIVHSRYLPRRTEGAIYEQVANECRDVGLPEPSRVEVRRQPRHRGAPAHIANRSLPAGWDGPLKGPQSHLDLWFDRPIAGPIVLGRARHFGLGLCLPFDDRSGQVSARGPVTR